MDTGQYRWRCQCVGVAALVRCRAIVYDAGQYLNGTGAVYTVRTHSRQHEVLTRAESTLAQHLIDQRAIERSPAHTKGCTIACLMLGQRRRWWASDGSALGQRLVFAKNNSNKPET